MAKHKGVGLLAVVQGLKANPRAAAALPPSVTHYLEERILPTGWYPESDYNVLIDVLARSVDRKAIGGDVWAFFGRIAARRDIAGEQEQVPRRSRLPNPGVYRRFADGSAQDVAGLFGRMTQLWKLYHDTGTASATRHESAHGTVVMCLKDFRFPHRGHADMQTAYAIEYGRLLGIDLRGELTTGLLSTDPHYVWTYEVRSDAEPVRASLAKLPSSRPSARPLEGLRVTMRPA